MYYSLISNITHNGLIELQVAWVMFSIFLLFCFLWLTQI